MGTFLSSVVVAALVAALVSMVTSERRIAAKNVIQERKIWREKIRTLAAEVFVVLFNPDLHNRENVLRTLRAKLFLLLNPHDIMDQEILQTIEVINTDRADEFTQRITLLLKHDWERAKREASLVHRLCEREPTRVAFEQYEPGRAHAYRQRRCLCL